MMTGKMNLALPSIGLPLIGEILPKSCRDVTRKRRRFKAANFVWQRFLILNEITRTER
jgi:hypothetical protein